MLAWHDIDTVLFDMDGTLLDLHFDTHFWREHLPARYAFTRGLDIATAKAVLTPWFRRHEGTLNWYCLDFWSRELDLDVAELKRDVAHLIAVKDGALEFLHALRRSGRRTVLVTNAHPRSMTLKLEHTRLDTHLDAIVSSHELGLPKEEPRFWAKLQAHEPYTPARTLLLDDNLAVLRAAQAFGIAHLLAAIKPDSRQATRPTTEFPAFEDFAPLTLSLCGAAPSS